MIVRDEEHNLAACLESVADLMDEIVVVDTGSTDRTPDVARRLGARVFNFPWVDSFAAARNECLRHATGEWIFWLDADERLTRPNRTKVRSLFAGLGQENKAYGMALLYLPARGTVLSTEMKYVRLFRNSPEMRWQNRVYEDITPALRAVGASVEWTDIVIHHAGHQDPVVRARKYERNLRLLQMDYADDPDNPSTLFFLGRMYLALGRPAEALPLLQRGAGRLAAGDPMGSGMYRLAVECHRCLGQTQMALDLCGAARARYPLDAGLCSQEAQLREELGDLAGAESCYLQLLREQEPNSYAGLLPPGMLAFWARNQLTALHARRGRTAEARPKRQRSILNGRHRP
jgi:tetratricopeptide (TPR) repeat protein